MKARHSVIVLLLAGAVQAGASAQLWLGGTRPYETVPYKEIDAEIYSGLASGGSGTGLRLAYGLLDSWMFLGSGEYQSMTDSWIGSAGTRAKFSEPGVWPLDLALYYDTDFGLESLNQQLGVVLAREVYDNDFSLNLGSKDFQDFSASAGYKTPYFYWTLRAGIDVTYSSAKDTWVFVPQLSSSLPGDIAIEFGAALSRESASPVWLLSLSYEIFQTP